MLVDDLLERLDEAGLEVQAYRGRNMAANANCVGAIIETIPDLALLGPELRPGLSVDNLATRFIAYWPEVLLPPGHALICRAVKPLGSATDERWNAASG